MYSPIDYFHAAINSKYDLMTWNQVQKILSPLSETQLVLIFINCARDTRDFHKAFFDGLTIRK